MLTIEILDTLRWENVCKFTNLDFPEKTGNSYTVHHFWFFFRLLNETFCKHKSCTKETAWTGKCPKLFSIGRLSRTNLKQSGAWYAKGKFLLKHRAPSGFLTWLKGGVSLSVLSFLVQWKLCSFMCWMVTALFPCSREHILRSQLRENCSSTTASVIVVSFKASVASWHTTCSKTFLKFKSSKPFQMFQL